MKKAYTKKHKICFASSSGGHFEQLSTLKPLMDKYDSIIVTEFTNFEVDDSGRSLYYLHQVNRKRFNMPFWMIINSFISLKILITEKPDFVVSTGALSIIPICLLIKLSGKKLIYIESFANVTAPSRTGTFLYRFADRFYVQWEPMKQFYPKAIYLGGIY